MWRLYCGILVAVGCMLFFTWKLYSWGRKPLSDDERKIMALAQCNHWSEYDVFVEANEAWDGRRPVDKDFARYVGASDVPGYVRNYLINEGVEL